MTEISISKNPPRFLEKQPERFGVSAREFGEFIGAAGNSVLRWERDEMRITEPVARLVRLLGRYPELADELRPRTRKK